MLQCTKRSLTVRAGTYKIPTANDIPMDFRVTLLKDAPCHRTPLAHSSKAIGEPPFFLGASVFFALKARPQTPDTSLKHALHITTFERTTRIPLAHSFKAIGEPPFLLSVFFALKVRICLHCIPSPLLIQWRST